MAKDYYKMLGVSKTASQADIGKAFKKLARKYHPDVNPGDKKAEETFKGISEAYEVLSNKDKRKKYDTYGSVDVGGFPGGGGRSYTYTYNPFEGGQAKYGREFDFNDLSDIFGDVFGGMGGVKGGQKRRPGRTYGPQYQRAPIKGKDLHFSISLDLLDAIKGCEKKVKLSNGVTFKVKIPAGVSDGSKIRLAGKGEPGHNGGSPGDLFIEPKIKSHPFFRRKEDDIELDLPLNLSEALAGAKVKVPTINGSVEMKIPAGSQSGQKMRLKGKGAKNLKTKKLGDQYVILQVRVPENLDVKTKEEVLQSIKGKEKDPRKHFWK